jgi:hypothetical protein
MKTRDFLILVTVIGSVAFAFAADVFPPFSKTTINVHVPTNTVGYISDPAFEAGSNAVYILHGQIFTNATTGRIQTIAEGFSGTTDRTTPWKTLTELLAVYHQGASSNSVKSLYTSDSQEFIDEIFTDAESTTRFQHFAASITNMQVLIGFDHGNGFYAITEFKTHKDPSDKMPYFFAQQANGKYLLSAFESTATNVSNIEVFLNTHSVTNLLP